MDRVNSKFWTHQTICAEIHSIDESAAVANVTCDSPFAVIGSGSECDITLSDSENVPARSFFVCFINGSFFGLNLNAYSSSPAKFISIDPIRGIRLGAVRIKFTVTPEVTDPPDRENAKTRTHILRWKEKGKRKFVRLAKNKPLLIGRASSSIKVVEPAISNAHCMILQAASQLWVVDLTDGDASVLVGGIADRTAELSHRDRFTLNGVPFSFYKIKSVEPDQATSDSDIQRKESKLTDWEEQLKSNRQAIEDEKNKLAERRSVLESDQAAFDLQKSNFEESCKERENELAWRVDEFEKTQQNRLTELQAQEQSLSAAQSSLDTLRAELMDKNAKLERQLKEAKEELEELRKSRRKMVMELHSQREAMLSQQIQSQADLQHRENFLDDRQKDIDEQLSELATLESRLEKERDAFLAQLRRTVNVDAVQSDLDQHETWTQDAHDVLGSREFGKILNKALDDTPDPHESG